MVLLLAAKFKPILSVWWESAVLHFGGRELLTTHMSENTFTSGLLEKSNAFNWLWETFKLECFWLSAAAIWTTKKWDKEKSPADKFSMRAIDKSWVDPMYSGSNWDVTLGEYSWNKCSPKNLLYLHSEAESPMHGYTYTVLNLHFHWREKCIFHYFNVNTIGSKIVCVPHKYISIHQLEKEAYICTSTVTALYIVCSLQNDFNSITSNFQPTSST